MKKKYFPDTGFPGQIADDTISVSEMNPQNWARVEQLFSQAASLSDQDRARFFGQLQESAEVTEQLRQLLSHHDHADSFLATPAWQAPAGGMQSLLPGQRVAGRFVVQRLLGRGGMGEVYLAAEPGQPPVALKILRDNFDLSEDGRRRFLREFSLARRIAHPNVCRVGELLATDDNLPAFTMEFLAGETLAEQLKAAGPFPEAEAKIILGEILDGLAAAHDAGVAHRDLKPENVMLLAPGGSPRAVLLDFGLARAEVRSPLTAVTRPDALLGTIDYMAPEQLRGEPAGLPADVYSVALLAHQLRSGKRLFAGPSPAAVLRRLVEPPELDSMFRGRWAAYLEASLHPDPRRRPTIRQARDILEGRRYYLRRDTRRNLLRAAAGFVIAGVATDTWRRFRPAAPIALPPGLVKVLVMPVTNLTGDPRLDGARQMLGDQILQSARLDVLTAGDIATGLAYLEKKGQTLTPELGRAVARRMGATLFVESTLSQDRDSKLLYVLDLELLSQHPGAAMQRWQQVFPTATLATLPDTIRDGANWIRKVAGEPAAEIAERSLPVAHATTANWDALLLYRRANDFKTQGKYLAAEPLFKEALALDPEFVSCRLIFADMLTNSYRAEEGAAVLRDALSMARRKGLSTRERYRVEAALGDEKTRSQAYQAWAVHFPNDFLPLYRQASDLADRFETEAAVRLYTQALEREEYFGIHSELGNEKMHLGRYTEVPSHIEALERLKHPDQAQILRGRLAHLQGDTSQAIAYFYKASSTGSTPWMYHARFLQMDAEAEAGDFNAARKLAEQGRAEQASVSNRAWEAQWSTAQAILAVADGFSLQRVDLRDVPGLRGHLAHALALRPHPISLTLAGLAGMAESVQLANKSFPPTSDADRLLGAAVLSLARGDSAGGYRFMAAAHSAGLHYTNIGNELLALAADRARRPADALIHWRRIAERPSFIWREVAHNWPGLIRLARRRVAALTAHSP